jgi:hypothetical protein
MPKDPQKMVISWQAEHPIATGFWSALSFGAWPPDGYFAVPSLCTSGDYGHGIPDHWYSLVVANAFSTFQWSRAITGAALFYFVSCLVSRRWRQWRRFRAAQTSSAPRK